LDSARLSRSVDRYQQAVFTWNALQNQLAVQLSQLQEWQKQDFRLDDPAVVGIYFQNAATLHPDDPANQSLDEVARWTNLRPRHIRALRALRITDLRGLAEAVNIAPDVERINRERDDLRRQLNDVAQPQEGQETPYQEPSVPPGLEPLPALSVQDAVEIRRLLGGALQARYERARQAQSPEQNTEPEQAE
jgi:hypothetical protein